jgi:hypothetical protein
MKYLILIISFLIVSCSQQDVVTIDGCQYIKTTSFNGNGATESLTHKGNCTNPIHNANKN